MEKARHDPAVNDAYRLRPATPEDAEFVRHLEKTCMETYAKALWPDFVWPTDAVFTNERFQIICIDNRSAGCVEMNAQDDGQFLDSLYLLPEFQGKGIGAAVLKDIKGRCRKSGARLRLSVLTSNPRAKTFYLREGFHIYRVTPERFFMEAA